MNGKKHVEEIAKTLDKIANDELMFCPECGEIVDPTDDGKCIECGTELETCTMEHYFDDALDIDYIVNSDRAYKAARIMIAYGDPTIYVNTWDQQVELYWWGDNAKCSLSPAAVSAIDEEFERLFYC